MLPLVLKLALLASGVGAFIGGYVLIHPEGGGGLVGFATPGPRAAALRALGGALLLAHAAALATLAQNPPIGSCLAAGLGAGWFGAAGGRAIGAAIERGPPKPLLRIGFEALMGGLMCAPLWTYLAMIREGRYGGTI